MFLIVWTVKNLELLKLKNSEEYAVFEPQSTILPIHSVKLWQASKKTWLLDHLAPNQEVLASWQSHDINNEILSPPSRTEEDKFQVSSQKLSGIPFIILFPFFQNAGCTAVIKSINKGPNCSWYSYQSRFCLW